MSKLVYQFFSPNGLKKNKIVSISSRLVLEEAERLGVQWKIIPGTQVVSLTYKGKTQSFYHQVPSSTTAVAKYISNNKKVCSNLLQQAGFSVSKSFRISSRHSPEYFKEVYDALKKPLVVKPSRGSLGKNISLDISTYELYLAAIEKAFAYSGKKEFSSYEKTLFGEEESSVVVEEMFQGTEYRILATKEKVIGIVRRRPGSVVGNGKDTINTLIRAKNDEPIRSSSKTLRSHNKIRKNQDLLQNLAEQNLDLSSVPKQGERIYLRKVSNVSQGGEAIDCTDIAHESVKQLAIETMRAIPGLSFAGIDFMTHDITAQQDKDSYIIIEINDTPGFSIHEYPYEGKNRHPSREFLFLMFPELKIKLDE